MIESRAYPDPREALQKELDWFENEILSGFDWLGTGECSKAAAQDEREAWERWRKLRAALAQPATAAAGDAVREELAELADMRDRAWKQAEHHARANQDSAAARCRMQFNALGKAIATLAAAPAAGDDAARLDWLLSRVIVDDRGVAIPGGRTRITDDDKARSLRFLDAARKEPTP